MDVQLHWVPSAPSSYCVNLQVLRNRTVSKEVRRLRAQALHELGGIFQDAAASHVEAAPVQDQARAFQLYFRSSTGVMKSIIGVPKKEQAASCSYTAMHQQSAS